MMVVIPYIVAVALVLRYGVVAAVTPEECIDAGKAYDSDTLQCIVCEDFGLVFSAATFGCVDPRSAPPPSSTEEKCYGVLNGFDPETKDCVVCEEVGLGFSILRRACVPCEDLRQIFSPEERRCVDCIFARRVWYTGDESDIDNPDYEGSEIPAFYCGTNWKDAQATCSTPCPSGEDSECPTGELCFADTSCRPPVYRQLHTCGTNWKDAVSTCGIPCPGAIDSECPTGERCFAETNCTYPIQSVQGGRCIDCAELGRVLHPVLKTCVDPSNVNVTGIP